MAAIVDLRNQTNLSKKNSVSYELKTRSKLVLADVFKKMKFFVDSKTKIFWVLFLFFKKLLSNISLVVLLIGLIVYNFHFQGFGILDTIKESLYYFVLSFLSILVISLFFFGLSEYTQKRV